MNGIEEAVANGDVSSSGPAVAVNLPAGFAHGVLFRAGSILQGNGDSPNPTVAIPWTIKPWGRTRCLLQQPTIEIWEAEVEAGGFCSLHIHKTKTNHFFVRSGVLKVQQKGTKTQVYSVGPNENCSVWGGAPHRFVAVTAVKMIEVYTPSQDGQTLQFDDIVRDVPGGRISLNKALLADLLEACP